MTDADRLNRTAKLFADDGSADSLDEAAAIHATYVLQVVVGRDVGASVTRQAILATVVNTGVRAFAGGVRIVLSENPVLTLPWVRGLSASEAVAALGADVVDSIEDTHPTIVIGTTDQPPPGSSVIYPTWHGWVGAAVVEHADRLREQQECELAGVLAGGLSVSEAFLHRYGHPPAGRRSVGLSLWTPDRDWRDGVAVGPPVRFLPESFWLAGLGHLGQGYAWTLGCLPYAADSAARVMLQDFDVVVEANASTGALTTPADIDAPKTRIVGRQLESVGFKTSITERRYDANTIRAGDEPVLLLAGFDRPEPRRELEPSDHGFTLAVDAGLGAGIDHYVDILVHSFPASGSAREAFPAAPDLPAPGKAREAAYVEYERTLIERGVETGTAACGTIEIEGRTVAVCFVGAVASTLVLSEPLRVLHGGERFEVVSLSLRSPEHLDAVTAPTARHPAVPFIRL